MEKRLKQINTLVIIITVSAIVMMCVLGFGYAPKEQNKLKTSGLKEFNDSWVYREAYGTNESIINLPCKVDATTSDMILIMHRVPEDVNSDTVLVFDTRFQNVMVSINDKRVYTNGVFNSPKLLKNAVSCTNIVEIGKASVGDVIYIYLESGYSKYAGEIGSIYYGTKGDVLSNMIQKNGVQLVLSILLLVVVLLFVISLLVLKNVNVDKKKAGYGFAFLIAAGCWTLLQNPLMQYVTKNVYGLYMCSMILLLILPILYTMYQRCFAVKRRYAKLYEILIYIYSVSFLTGAVFQFVGVCDFAAYMSFAKPLIVAGLIFMSVIMFLAADTFSDKSIYTNFHANNVIVVACIAQAVLSKFDFYRNYNNIALQLGLLIFMTLLIISIEKTIIKEMNQTKQEEINEINFEKSQIVQNINSKYILNALAFAAKQQKDGENDYGRLIYDISAYFKNNIRALTDSSLVPFETELLYIKAFLAVSGKVNLYLDVVVEDKVVDFKVPFNTIEPIVENAVINGALKNENGGRIVLRSYERLDCYAIQIVDNGKGISPDKLFLSNYSYKNIKKKLKNECNASIEVKTKPGKGTILTVKIPKSGYIIKE